MEKYYKFDNFTIKEDKEKFYLFSKKADELGNEYYTRTISVHHTETSRVYDDWPLRDVFLEIVKLKKENEDLKFHLKVQDNIK